MVLPGYTFDRLSPPLPPRKALPIYFVFLAGLTGIVALGGATFCLYYFVKKRWESGRGSGGGRETGVDLRQATLPPEVGMTIIENLHIASYPPAQRDGLELDPTRLICLEDMREGENVTVLPCHHFFHPHCIASELRHRARCPKCFWALV